MSGREEVLCFCLLMEQALGWKSLRSVKRRNLLTRGGVGGLVGRRQSHAYILLVCGFDFCWVLRGWDGMVIVAA